MSNSTSPPQISVLLRVGSSIPRLESTLQSLRQQTHESIQLLVIADGSDDATWQAIQAIDWPQLRAHRFPKPRGQGASFELARTWTIGDYIVCLHAGETSPPHRFEVQAAHLDRHEEIAAVTTSADWVDEAGTVLNHFEVSTRFQGVVNRLKDKDAIAGGSVMIRREILDDLNGFQSVFQYAALYDLLLRLVETHEIASFSEVQLHIPFDVMMPDVVRCSEIEAYRDLARQLARERRDHGQQMSDLTASAQRIAARFRQMPQSARRKMAAEDILITRTLVKQYAAPPTVQRKLWLEAFLMWPFSLSVWRALGSDTT